MGPVKFVGLCFVIFAAFGAGYYYKDLSGAGTLLTYANASPGDVECEVAEPIAGSADEFCAILTMPKSLVPFLERLKRNKLAKDVIITPATVGSANGRMTAVAHNKSAGESVVGPGNEAMVLDKEAQADQSGSSIWGALAVYFLAGSKRQSRP